MTSTISTVSTWWRPRLGWTLDLRRFLASRWASWTTIEDLSQLDDRALRDIGLFRDDILGAAARALWDRVPSLLVTL